MAGKFYGVGVGPGDPELLTIKAKKILEQVPWIAIPVSGETKESLAWAIVADLLEGHGEILKIHLPMSYNSELLEKSWHEASEVIGGKLAAGTDVAFITLGDPTLYSTFIYLYQKLKNQGYPAEIVPGVPSFCAAAARAGISLAENQETLVIVPSVYHNEDLKEILNHFDNVVLMKAGSNFPLTRNFLEEEGLLDRAVLVSRCGLPDEMVEFDLTKIAEDQVGYLTTMIIKKNGVHKNGLFCWRWSR